MKQLNSRLRGTAVSTVIAMVPLAIMLIAMTDLLKPPSESRWLDFELATAIEESGTTVGIADSDLWALSKPDGSMDTAAMNRHLDEMQALGVSTVRVILPWRGNEPVRPGTFPPAVEQSFWARSDYIIDAAASRGMAVLAVLGHAPNWAGTDPNMDWSLLGLEEPPDPQLFGEYAARVVERYGDKIGAYEIWNEPNYVKAWAPQISAAAYTEVLKAAWTAIKGADGPDANDPLVVAGVLGAVISSPFTLDPVTFVDTMYDSGAKGFFDALSFHPYHYTLEFSEGVKNDFWRSPLEQLIEIRQLMLANGDAALRIWATEYGLPTFGTDGVTEQHQADFIEDFLNAWKNLKDADGTSYAGPSFVYTLRDRLVDGVLTQNTSLGIFNVDWTAKLAAQVIKDFIEANQNPDPPDDTPNPPSLAELIAQALQAFFQQIQAVGQGIVSAVGAVVNAIAQAIANIFNPGGAAAASLSSAVQDDVADATSVAAASWDAAADETVTEAEDAAAETISADDTVVPQEVAEIPDAEPEESTEPEGSETDTTDDAEEAEEADNSESATEFDEDGLDAGDTGDLTEPESREPVRTGLVARPSTIGDGDSDDSTDSDEATTASDTTSDDSSDGSESGSESGGAS